jgi:hypothetical protein
MKKTIGLGLLMVTAMTAFAAPYERGREVRKEIVVVHHNRRARSHRVAGAKYDRFR